MKNKRLQRSLVALDNSVVELHVLAGLQPAQHVSIPVSPLVFPSFVSADSLHPTVRSTRSLAMIILDTSKYVGKQTR
jgi:hypothetical protein